MARNEEKQLARLNRFYLEKQKQEELKKRPPRPRLDTLNTARELRKWLPTITRDIEFYVQQMEVTCYTDKKIEEIQDQIQRLKQEYRAYLHKLRALEPDLNASSWADRPYAHRKRHRDNNVTQEGEDTGTSAEPEADTSAGKRSTAFTRFVPIPTPVLQRMPAAVNLYTLERPAPVLWNANPETQDQPLQFAAPAKTSAVCGQHHAPVPSGGSGVHHTSGSPSPEKRSLPPAALRTWAVSDQRSACGTDTTKPGTEDRVASPAGLLQVTEHAGVDGKERDSLKIATPSSENLLWGSGPSRTSVMSGTSMIEGDTVKWDHADADKPRLVGVDQCDDLGKESDSSASATTNMYSGRLGSGCGEKPAGTSPARDSACGVSAGSNQSLGRTCESVSVKDGSVVCGPRAVNSTVHPEPLPSSNPLNLNYSDSSDDDVE